MSLLISFLPIIIPCKSMWDNVERYGAKAYLLGMLRKENRVVENVFEIDKYDVK